mmetsp:Transcript_26655/g.85533  ORF Transcript_26655/g.85533 Transcript_26655/m.85533 type:complete len:115 (-) Transcript_26655:179-523(-)
MKGDELGDDERSLVRITGSVVTELALAAGLDVACGPALTEGCWVRSLEEEENTDLNKPFISERRSFKEKPPFPSLASIATTGIFGSLVHYLRSRGVGSSDNACQRRCGAWYDLA